MIEDGFAIRDSPLSASVLSFFKEVPIVSAKQFGADPSPAMKVGADRPVAAFGGQVVQFISGNSDDLNGAQ
jgi:hypothetical protein